MRKSLIVTALIVGFFGAGAQTVTGTAAKALDKGEGQTVDKGSVQPIDEAAARRWVDSVFKTLTGDEKIAQLMVIRMSAIDPATRGAIFFDSIVNDAVRKYNVGGVCLFQGGPLSQAARVNYLQSFTKTPILFCIDGENGLGMRMDSVLGLPRQMMLGAMRDPSLMYQYGRLVGEQCKRIGIQVNYAPVVDVNNNPDNPVINDRSFGEDKNRVAAFGVQYMKGMQDAGVMACAKHFPGHGDVSVDSHFDLPVINKTVAQMEGLELYPFKALFDAGVGSVMIAHLYIPDIDNTPNQATSLSNKAVTKLLRKKMKYNGISFTDALEMKGVAKYYPDGAASVQSLIAGNDMLCLPGDVATSLAKINEAIIAKKLKWSTIDERVKRVLYAKYVYGLASFKPVDTAHLTADLNDGVREMRRQVAENALTLLRYNDPAVFPFTAGNEGAAAPVGRVPFVPFSTDAAKYSGLEMDSRMILAAGRAASANAGGGAASGAGAARGNAGVGVDLVGAALPGSSGGASGAAGGAGLADGASGAGGAGGAGGPGAGGVAGTGGNGSAGGNAAAHMRQRKIAYIGLGLTNENELSRRLRADYNAHVYFFDYGLDSVKAAAALELLSRRYDAVVIGLHNYARFPARNFAISQPVGWLLQQLSATNKTITFAFGNPYAIRNTCAAPNLVACYEDDSVTQTVAADWLGGKFAAKGQLPVSVCTEWKSGDGIVQSIGGASGSVASGGVAAGTGGAGRTGGAAGTGRTDGADGTADMAVLPTTDPASLGLDPRKLDGIDAIAREAIDKQAAPGCVVLVAKDGKIAYHKAFGYMSYDKTEPVYKESIYDLASVTKICATTMSVMKLYDEGRLDLQKTLGDYLPWVRGSDKAGLKIMDVMLHQARLNAFIPFYRETMDTSRGGAPLASLYVTRPDSAHGVRVGEGLYLRNNWEDTIYRRILDSKLGPADKYVYSDNDFIFMGKVVEAISGMRLDDYVRKTYYEPLGMKSTGFLPRERFPLGRIAPTAMEPIFRQQLIRGDVHDPGSAMFGGVAGHAGLFSDAYDLAILEQMLLNGGTMNGQRFLKKETIDYFTAYHSSISRRGIGFDKPEKDNATRKEPYPCLSASPETFGHTGFTGTCVWVDPKNGLLYIFLSNRVNPVEGNPKLGNLLIRGRIQETIYQAMGLNEGAKHGVKTTKKKKRK